MREICEGESRDEEERKPEEAFPHIMVSKPERGGTLKDTWRRDRKQTMQRKSWRMCVSMFFCAGGGWTENLLTGNGNKQRQRRMNINNV